MFNSSSSARQALSRVYILHLRFPDGRPILFWGLVLVGACQSGTVLAGLCLIHHHRERQNKTAPSHGRQRGITRLRREYPHTRQSLASRARSDGLRSPKTPSTVRPWARGFCPHGRPGPLGFGLCGRLPRHGVGGFMFNSSSSFAITETHQLAHEKMARMHKQLLSQTIQLCSSTCLGDEARPPKGLRSGSKSSWVVNGRRAARASAPSRDRHEVASEAAQKPSSTPPRRSEDHALLSTTVCPEDLRRAFFVYVRWRLQANFT